MTDLGSRTPVQVAEIGAIPAAIHRAALEHASEFFTLSDPTGDLLWVSPAVVAVLGYNPDEFVATPAWSLLHPDDVERVRRVAADLAGDLGGRRRVQYRARHADDSWRWIEAVSSNLLDRPGVEGIVSTLRDVTSRVMAKRRLSQSERRLRSIVSSAGDVIAILDERGGIDYVTPTIATLLQRSATVIQDNWANYVHPDDLQEMFALFRVALDDPGVTKGPIDIRLLRGDGQWLTVETLFTDYRTDPIVRGIVLNARDVSERRQVEASERANQKIFNALVEMAPVGIFLTDSSGEWTYVNARIGTDFGFEPGDLLGTGWMQLFDAADVVRLRSELARWDGLGRYVTELRTRTSPDARELRLTLSRPQSDGDQLGAVGTLEDVTSRRGLEEMLLDGAALGSVAGVVGSAAHDLHNLLASIGFQLGVLELADDDGDRVDAANEAIDRACDITEDLMAMSRPSRSRVGPLEVGSVIAGLSDMLRVLVEHQADLAFIDSSDGLLSAADKSGLERVVTNLVVNSRDAVEPRGKIAVHVAVTDVAAGEHEALSAGPHVAVSVIDNGCGVADAFKDRMFEPYFTTKEDGNGIGLAASRRTVRAWGGDIGVESVEGKGTTVTVYLPVIDPR